MHSFHKLSVVIFVFFLSFQVLARQHKPPVRSSRHRRSLYDVSNSAVNHKRQQSNAAFTYFTDGQGACGITNGPNDFIVALNSAQYDDGAHCFASITITVNGKTAQAQITDECPGCAYGGLDFSQGLFQYFAPLSQGELYGSWYYNSEAPTSTSTTPTPTPTPTPTEAPTSHTPTWTSPPTTMATSTSTSTSISTSSSLSSSMSWTASSSTSLISASGSSPVSTPPPVPTFTSQNPQILVQIDLGLIELGSLLQTSLSF